MSRSCAHKARIGTARGTFPTFLSFVVLLAEAIYEGTYEKDVAQPSAILAVYLPNNRSTGRSPDVYCVSSFGSADASY